MLTPRTFEKVMSRDASLLMIEAWSIGAEACYPEFGLPEYAPVEVFINEKGLITNYYDGHVVELLRPKIVKVAEENPNYFVDLFREYEGFLQELKRIWSAGTALPWTELIRFFDLIVHAWRGMEWSYFVPTIPTIPKPIFDLAIHHRHAGESFFDSSDRVFRTSLSALHPNVSLVHLMSHADLKAGRLPTQNIREKREQAYIVVQGSVLDEDPEIVLKRLNIVLEVEAFPVDAKEVKGLVASSGNARGRARIIRTKDALPSFKTGEVLVTTMTTPDFLPAVQKAAAIVTDEGGVTCHAAIVSRELKKPCVIGTKIATAAFRDGDLLEVDAKHGIVRKIEA